MDFQEAYCNTITISGGIVIAFPNLKSDVQIDEDQLKAFAEKVLAPLIKNGVTKGEIALEGVRVASVSLEDGSLSEWGYLDIPVDWVAHLPWWHRDNLEWWKAPFCDYYVVA